MNCEEYLQRRVKLGYVADEPTKVQLVDSIGNQVFDMLPIVQAGETDTSMELDRTDRKIRYLPEQYTRTDGKQGCYYEICIPDIAALIRLNDLEDVDAPTPRDGDTIVFDAASQQYLNFNIVDVLNELHRDVINVNNRVDEVVHEIDTINESISLHTRQIKDLFEQLTLVNKGMDDLSKRLTAIENAIYNWGGDKETKIARGNINVTSGGFLSGNGLYTRTPDTDEDLNFE